MMKMLIAGILALGAVTVMAKETPYKPTSPNTPISPEEEFFNSEEGQDITRMFDEFTSGKKTYDEVYEEYNKKWADKPLPQPPSQVPQAPLKPPR